MNDLRFFRQPLWVRAVPFTLIYTINLLGFSLDVLEIDSAQYAELAREMLASGSYLQVFDRGRDYLDKPPLLFWLTALFYKLFGVSAFVFRLPSFLVAVLGHYATYRLASRYYGPQTGYLAALIAASTQAAFMAAHDVRMDTMLTGAVIVSIWQLDDYLRTRRVLNLLLGFTGVAAAMLTKGPIGIVVPVMALATDFALKRQWRLFFQWQWLVGIAWVGLLLVPMCIGLYEQFDLHPEKVMYGRSGTSGLRFFFWTQSFGRITGESVWDNNPDPLFLVHTFLWAFLPWCLFFLVAFYRKATYLIQNRFRLPDTAEGLSFGGFLLPLLALMTSRYQLPHYVFVLLPLAAILTATYLHQVLIEATPGVRVWRWVQLFVGTLLWAVAMLIVVVVFPDPPGYVPVWLGLWLVGMVFFVTRRTHTYRLVGLSLLSIVGLNGVLNDYFYPNLFRYQAGSVAARYVQSAGIDPQRLYLHQAGSYALDFGLRRVIPDLSTAPRNVPVWAYTTPDAVPTLQQQYGSVSVVKTFAEYPVSMLRGPFLNPATRDSQLEKRCLVRVGK
jgi:4-amino-4-deoxy-L-arabinose transferase-like glycosyltransferase